MKLKTLGLTITAFVLSLFAAQAQTQEINALSISPASGSSVVQIALEDIQRITFSGAADLSLKTLDGNETVYALSNIQKIIFDHKTNTNMECLIAPGLEAILHYLTPAGELVVESQRDIKSLTLFSIEGKMIQTTRLSTMYVGTLSSGVYILKIDTPEGPVVRKIIK